MEAKNVRNSIRDELVAVAREVFSQYGYKKTTLDDIARASHRAKSSIYYYFENKEEIFRAVVEKEASVLRVEIVKAINRQSEPREKLRSYVLTRLKVFRELANYYSAVKNDFLTSFAFIENMRARYDREEVDIICQILVEGVEKGKLSIPDPERAAMAIVTAIKGLEFPLAFNADSSMDQRLSDMMSLMYHGIKKADQG